jgi:hypothetical protein
MANPHLWLDAVKSLDIWVYVRDEGFTLADIGSKIGRQGQDAVRRLMRDFLASDSRQVISTFTEHRALQHIERRLWWSAR